MQEPKTDCSAHAGIARRTSPEGFDNLLDALFASVSVISLAWRCGICILPRTRILGGVLRQRKDALTVRGGADLMRAVVTSITVTIVTVVAIVIIVSAVTPVAQADSN